MDRLNIDQLIDVRKAPVWVRILLMMKPAQTHQMPGWLYFVEYKSLFGKHYFIRAYITPGRRLKAEGREEWAIFKKAKSDRPSALYLLPKPLPKEKR